MNLRLLNLKFFLLLLTFLNFSPLLAEEEVEEYLEEEALEYLQENALIEDESLQAKAVPECVKNPVPYMQSLNPMNVLEGCFDVLSGSPFYRDEGLVVGNGQNALTWQGFISDLQGVHRISAKNYHALSWRTRKKDCEAFITDLYLGQVKRGGYDIHDATPENQYQRMYFSSKVENKYKKDSQFKIDYKTHGYLKSDQYSNSYNTNFDNISARNNLKNMKLSLWWPEPKSESLLSLSQPLNYVEGHFELTEGDGRVKIYNQNFLQEEKLPNGNRILYHYDSETTHLVNPLKKIELVNSNGKPLENILLSLNLIPETIDGSVRNSAKYLSLIRGSNGKTISYTENAWDFPFKCKIESSDGPEAITSRTYNKGSSTTDQAEINHPEGRFLKAIPKNSLLQNQHLLRQKIQVPDNQGNEETLYETSHIGHHSSNVVGDSLGEVKAYFKSHKSLELQFFDKRGDFSQKYYNDYILSFHQRNLQYYRSHLFFWDETVLGKNEQIKCRAVKDAEKNVLSAWMVNYDERGNILEERIAGNLTGKSGRPLKTMESSQQPTWEQEETFTKFYTYSEDGFNLKLSEQEQNGPLITYSYRPGTNLLEKKLTISNGKILCREFYEYDEDANLACYIIDDGSSECATDLSGVTERRLQKTIYGGQIEKPGCGYPLEIANSYLDMATGQEALLKREVLTYEFPTRVIKKEVFDSQNTLSYTLDYAYDAKSNLIYETNAEGEAFVYAYDANKNRIRSEKLGTGVCTVYTYNFRNWLVKEEEVHPSETLIRRYTYDIRGRKTSETDPLGRTTFYTYDVFGRCTSEKKAKIKLADGQTTEPQKRFAYDIYDRMTLEIDEKEQQKKVRYNDYSNPIEIIDKDGSKETFEYHVNGLLERYTHKNGNVTLYTYDPLKRITSEITYSTGTSSLKEGQPLKTHYYTYNAFHLVSEVDAMGHVTEYFYDGAGRKVLEVKKGGKERKTSYGYDTLGRLTETRKFASDSEYVALIEEFDHLDRVIEKRTEDSQGKISHRETYLYDLFGNVTEKRISLSDGESSLTRITYNSRALPILEIDPLGHSTVYSYAYPFSEALEQQILEKTKTDPLGNRTVERFNWRGKVTDLQQYNPYGTLKRNQETSYDEAGLPTESIYSVLDDGKELRVYIVQQKYDEMGRLIELIEDPDGECKRTAYHYNAYGELEILEKPDSTCLYHTYDRLGRLASLTSSDDTIQYSYFYDKNDNLLAATDELHDLRISRRYDSFNQLILETIDGRKTHYGYDRLGRIIELTLPNQSSVHYAYHGAQLKAVERKGSDGVSLYRHEYEKTDWLGNPLLSQLPKKGGKVQQTIDSCGRVQSIKASHWSLDIPKDGYDWAGNLRRAAIQDPLSSFNVSYDYDDLYQLTEEKGPIEHTYRSDSINNRLHKDGKDYEISSLNQVKGDGESSYFYDRSGNLIEKRKGGLITRYGYDALNRMTSVEEANNWRLECRYDSFGRRLNKKSYRFAGGAWQEEKSLAFLFQGELEIGAVDEDGQVRELRILGKGKGAEVGAAIAIELSSGTFAPINDQRGNVVALIDIESGEVAEFYRYSAFGEMLTYDAEQNAIPSSVLENPWGFASKRKDLETGFICFGKRYYDPQLGRWITPDPAGFADGPNLYAYVKNNPLILFDPYGLSAWDAVCSFTTDFVTGAAEGCYEVVSETVCLGIDTAVFAIDAAQNPVQAFNDSCNALSEIAEGIQNLDMEIIQEAIQHEIEATCKQFREMDSKNAGKMVGRMAGSSLIRRFVQSMKALKMIDKTAKNTKKISNANKANKPNEAKSGKKARGEHLKPDPKAKGDHSVFKRHGETGEITHYETYKPQTNPKDPKDWEFVKRYDGVGPKPEGHYNKALDKYIPEPHIHDPISPGGIRTPDDWERPRR